MLRVDLGMKLTREAHDLLRSMTLSSTLTLGFSHSFILWKPISLPYNLFVCSVFFLITWKHNLLKALLWLKLTWLTQVAFPGFCCVWLYFNTSLPLRFHISGIWWLIFYLLTGKHIVNHNCKTVFPSPVFISSQDKALPTIFKVSRFCGDSHYILSSSTAWCKAWLPAVQRHWIERL